MDAIISVLSTLEASKLCEDNKFAELVSHHNGTFKDQSILGQACTYFISDCERLTFYFVLIQHFLSNPSSQSTKPLFSLAIAIGIIKVIMYHENILSLDKRNNQSKTITNI